MLALTACLPRYARGRTPPWRAPVAHALKGNASSPVARIAGQRVPPSHTFPKRTADSSPRQRTASGAQGVLLKDNVGSPPARRAAESPRRKRHKVTPPAPTPRHAAQPITGTQPGKPPPPPLIGWFLSPDSLDTRGRDAAAALATHPGARLHRYDPGRKSVETLHRAHNTVPARDVARDPCDRAHARTCGRRRTVGPSMSRAVK